MLLELIPSCNGDFGLMLLAIIQSNLAYFIRFLFPIFSYFLLTCFIWTEISIGAGDDIIGQGKPDEGTHGKVMPPQNLNGASLHSASAFVVSEDQPTSADSTSNAISPSMSTSPSPRADLTSQYCHSSHLQGVDSNKKTKVIKCMLSIWIIKEKKKSSSFCHFLSWMCVHNVCFIVGWFSNRNFPSGIQAESWSKSFFSNFRQFQLSDSFGPNSGRCHLHAQYLSYVACSDGSRNCPLDTSFNCSS